MGLISQHLVWIWIHQKIFTRLFDLHGLMNRPRAIQSSVCYNVIMLNSRLPYMWMFFILLYHLIALSILCFIEAEFVLCSKVIFWSFRWKHCFTYFTGAFWNLILFAFTFDLLDIIIKENCSFISACPRMKHNYMQQMNCMHPRSCTLSCLVLFLDDLFLVLNYFRIITFRGFLATIFSIWQYWTVCAVFKVIPHWRLFGNY